jgi:acetyltransferase-like isoleucine patch superfamily enzyme
MADIGCECVIGAGSVVTREVAELSIAAGNPARVIQLRTDLAKDPRG